MCLIIAPGEDGKPALLPRDVFDFAYKRNQDGFGAMWVEDGQVKHFKTLGLSADEIYTYMEEYTTNHPDVIFHMRLKTHGKVSPALCHPFRILHRSRHGKDLLFMHNGILSNFGKVLTPGQSDTTSFKDKILVPLLSRNPDALDDPAILQSITKMTLGSRLTFLDSKGKVHLTGDWNNRYGLTLSNNYMLPTEQKPYEPVSKLPRSEGTGVYSIFRKIRYDDGSFKDGWFTHVENELIRSELGALFRDRGVNKDILFEKDYIPKDAEFRYLSVGAYMNSHEWAKEELNDDLPPFGEDLDKEDDKTTFYLNDDDDEGAEIIGISSSVLSLEAKLRYARIFQNVLNGKVESRPQLLADILGMGREEMLGLIKEDPESSHTIMEDLFEIVLEQNALLGMFDEGNDDLGDVLFDSDELLKIGSMDYHREAMKDLADIRRLRYKTQLAERLKKDGSDVGDTLDVPMVNEG